MKQKNTVVVKTVVAIAAMAAALCGVADEAEKPLKVLMIGNSFSICNLREIPNPPGLYEHDLKVHKVSLDACNLKTEDIK